MNKKTLQVLINLSTRSSTKLDNTNILDAVNRIPKGNQIDLKQNAKQYATSQLQLNYGIVTVESMSRQEIKSAQEIIKNLNELNLAKPIRLAAIIERITQKVNFEELQQARQFLQTLNRKEIKEMKFTIDTLAKVVDEKVEEQQEKFENHTLKAAYNLIQELKKTKKIDQL